jgi:uncharacterized membrane protein YoaK (UPF0700 family)
MGSPPGPNSSASYWVTDIDFALNNPKRANHIPFLLLLSFAAGAIDVFSVPYLGVFTANNTGNIVFLALAGAQLAEVDPGDVHPIAAITSLLASWFGSLVSGQIGNFFGRRKRLMVFCDALQQAVLVFLCVGLIWGGKLNDVDQTKYVVVALLSFSMGCQNTTTKGMNGPPTIPTQVATGAMADFFSDPRLLALRNRPRDERLIFVIVFFAGGLVGGLAYRYYAPHLCLLLTAIFKLLAALLVLVLRRVDHKDLGSNSSIEA